MKNLKKIELINYTLFRFIIRGGGRQEARDKSEKSGKETSGQGKLKLGLIIIRGGGTKEGRTSKESTRTKEGCNE